MSGLAKSAVSSGRKHGCSLVFAEYASVDGRHRSNSYNEWGLAALAIRCREVRGVDYDFVEV